ncbi:MAG: hypothetical protein IJM76_02870 [Lachnospiraceae bacterium]|nr:hypothetical protein [Lachnospiraceae bacterium]
MKNYVIDGSRAFASNKGVFQGWGSSLCWWAHRVGYDDTVAEIAAKAFCDPEAGLGINVLRYNIGGGDDPAHDHIMRTDSAIPGFWKDPKKDPETGAWTWDYDWEQDRNQVNTLRKCLEAGQDMIVEGFSNSPPYFMTVSGCTSGADPGTADNLREDAVDDFAAYMADVTEHFDKVFGIRFQSVEPMNEPHGDWEYLSPKQEGCHIGAEKLGSAILVAMRKALDKRGLQDIPVAGTDEPGVEVMLESLKLLSPEAIDAIARVDTHTYHGDCREELRDLILAKGKDIWMSEVDGGEVLGEGSGEMGPALWLAKRICDDMNGLNPSAWVLWQLIDQHISSEGMNGRRDMGMVDRVRGYWGTAVMDHDKKELLLTMKYYALGQFSRYLRPGCRPIPAEGDFVAAVTPDGKELVITAVNTEGTEVPAAFEFRNLSVKAGAEAQVIRTSGSIENGEHWKTIAPLTTRENGLDAVLQPFSVTTFFLPLAE